MNGRRACSRRARACRRPQEWRAKASISAVEAARRSGSKVSQILHDPDRAPRRPARESSSGLPHGHRVRVSKTRPHLSSTDGAPTVVERPLASRRCRDEQLVVSGTLYNSASIRSSCYTCSRSDASEEMVFPQEATVVRVHDPVSSAGPAWQGRRLPRPGYSRHRARPAPVHGTHRYSGLSAAL